MAFSITQQLALLFLLFLLLPLAFSADPSIYHYCGGKTFNTAITNPLQSNINSVLSDLIKRTPPSGYAVSFHGQDTNTVSGLTRCRGDVPSDACATCIAGAAKQLPSLCPNRTDARIWYDYCFLRYDDGDFIGKLDASNGVVLYNANNATDPVRFEGEVKELMGRVEDAALGSYESFGWGVKELTGTMTVRGMAQCTRDLPTGSCRECLESALGLLRSFCGHRRGCQVLYSSCVVRYEIYDFLYEREGSGGGDDGLEKMMIVG